MKIIPILEKEDYDNIREQFFEVYENFEAEISDEDCEEFFNLLPEDIKRLSYQVGLNDTQVQEEICQFITKNKI